MRLLWKLSKALFGPVLVSDATCHYPFNIHARTIVSASCPRDLLGLGLLGADMLDVITLGPQLAAFYRSYKHRT
jgi:hypothetical protein